MSVPTLVRAYPSSGTFGVSGASTFSGTVDCNGGDDLLVFFSVGAQGGNCSAVVVDVCTWNGSGSPVALTQVMARQVNASSLTSCAFIYRLPAPAQASGTLTITWSGDTGGSLDTLTVQAMVHTGVVSYDGTVTIDNPGTDATSDSCTRSVGANSIAVGSWFHGSNISSGTPGTVLGVVNNLTTVHSSGCGVALTGTTIGFTSGTSDSHYGFMVELVGAAPPPGGNRAPAAATFVKQVGTVTNTTAATTSAITVAAGGVPVGDMVIIVGSHDNSGTNGAVQATTITDTRGNDWRVIEPHAIADPGAANAGQEGWIAYAAIAVALQAGDTITISYPTSTAAKAIRADQFHNVGLLIGYANQDNQTGQAVSVAVTATLEGQLVIGGVMVEGGTADTFNQDADTTNGSWVNPGRLGSGTTTSGATLNPIYKIVTDFGVQTYDGATMLGTSRDHCAALAVFAVIPYASRRTGRTRRRGSARVI